MKINKTVSWEEYENKYWNKTSDRKLYERDDYTPHYTIDDLLDSDYFDCNGKWCDADFYDIKYYLYVLKKELDK